MTNGRRAFIWTSIIIQISLILGIGLYCLIDRNDDNVLAQSISDDPLLSFQEKETGGETDVDQVDDEDGKGGPYTVFPFLHMSVYHAKNGDSLWTIAEKNGLDFYTILSVNRLDKANKISIGQKLNVPNQRGILHTVNKEETLEDIALTYDVGIRNIIRVNRILDPGEIKEGSNLFIPGAKVSPSFSKELLQKRGIPSAFIFPCRRCRISSRFGYRQDPFSRQRAFHSGLDLAPGYGAIVNAAEDGRVTFAGYMGGYGKLVVIKHANGFETRYGHLSQIRVKKGKYIQQGQRIGNVGSTGRSTGAHLHFEVRQHGKALNPLNFVSH